MIRDFLSSKIETGVLFEGTYGIEIEAESLKRQPFKVDHDHDDEDSFTFWKVKLDDSLRHFGNEFVLKAPVYYETVDEALQEFADKTRKIKFLQDSISTSVHVHVNMLPETWVCMANFLTIYTLVEGLLIEYSGEYRRNNLFCLPIRSVPHVNKVCMQLFDYVQDKNFNFKRTLDQEQIKYAALNLSTLYRFGSVEVRSFRGVTDIVTIKTWVDIVHKMLLFSRLSGVTPPTIMDQYREKGNELLIEIFGDHWHLLAHREQERLLKQNLWYASTLAYHFDEDTWLGLDKMPEVSEVDQESLDKIARRIYGDPFVYLDMECREVVMRIWEDENRAKKIKFKKKPNQGQGGIQMVGGGGGIQNVPVSPPSWATLTPADWSVTEPVFITELSEDDEEETEF